MILQFIQAAFYCSQNMLTLTNLKWSTYYNIKCFGIVVFYGQLFVWGRQANCLEYFQALEDYLGFLLCCYP